MNTKHVSELAGKMNCSCATTPCKCAINAYDDFTQDRPKPYEYDSVGNSSIWDKELGTYRAKACQCGVRTYGSGVHSDYCELKGQIEGGRKNEIL